MQFVKLSRTVLMLFLTAMMFCSFGCKKEKKDEGAADQNAQQAIQSTALACPEAPAKPQLANPATGPVVLKSHLKPGDTFLSADDFDSIISMSDGAKKIEIQVPIASKTKITITGVDQNGIISGIFTPIHATIQMKGPMEAKWDSQDDPKTWPNDSDMRQYLDVVNVPIPFKLSAQHKLIQVDYSALETKLSDRYSEEMIIEIKKDTESDISNILLEFPSTPVQVGDTIPGHPESMDLEGGGHLDVNTTFKILAITKDAGSVLLEPQLDFSGESPADAEDFHLYVDNYNGWYLVELGQGLVGKGYMNFCFRTTAVRNGSPVQTGMIAKGSFTITKGTGGN